MDNSKSWIVLCGVGVRCNICGARLEVPDDISKWHDQLANFIAEHSSCDERTTACLDKAVR